MNYQTHFWGGVAAGSLVLLATHTPPSATAIPALMIAGVCGLLPDIDHGGSLPNHLLGLGGKVVAKVVSHRTVTHSLFAAAVLAASLFALHVSQLYLFMALSGMLSHLVLDTLNPHGVPWLWPVKQKFGLPLVTTGHFTETVIVRPAMWVLTGLFIARWMKIM